MSLKDAITYYLNSIECNDSFTNYNTNYKPENKLFPFLEDGAGNCYWVDLNKGTVNQNRIFWTNTFGENPAYLYESLQNMFAVISESYEKGIIFLDEDAYLDMDFDAFHKLSGNHNPNVPYWK